MADTTDFWARHASEWQKPGARVRDPVSGAAWRRGWANHRPDWLRDGEFVFERGDESFDAIDRAVAAGPDLDDEAMFGILLAWLVRVCWGFLQIRTVTESIDPDVALNLYDARDKVLAQALYGAPGMVIERALRWALTSDDSPVREVK